MNLAKEEWSQGNAKEFLNYLQSLGSSSKEAWARRILNTKMELLVIPTPTIKKIVAQIGRGNYISFLDLKIFNNYESVVIYGSLLCKIKDFLQLKYYLDVYLTVAENWAHCDILSFDINSNNKTNFINLANEYITSPYTFTRRVALIILMHMVKDKSVLPIIFKTLNSLNSEEEYYVNMAGAWLLCECFIQHREETINFFKENSANKI